MSSDPWRDIEVPRAASAISAKRVDEREKWDFFWARDLDRRRLLVLLFRCDPPAGRLPSPKGIELAVRTDENEHTSMLVLTLLDQAQADIFYRLCVDVIASTLAASTESEAVSLAVARTWRWHHLLRGGSDGRLSLEEQKGLIGELTVLEGELLPRLAAADAVDSWVGPTGAPKDFELGEVCIEAKARRGTAEPFVAISSEHQLDTHGLRTLFLHVTDLARGTADSNGAFSVSDLARRVAHRVADLDPGAIQPFECLIAAAGLKWDDDYSDSLWLESGTRVYEVAGAFPRMAASSLLPGISRVGYSIALVACEAFAVEADAIARALVGAGNADRA